MQLTPILSSKLVRFGSAWPAMGALVARLLALQGAYGQKRHKAPILLRLSAIQFPNVSLSIQSALLSLE